MTADELARVQAEEVAARGREWHAESPVCPNADDPVLCKVHGGVFVPECGCPAHDPDMRPVLQTALCRCGHTKLTHPDGPCHASNRNFRCPCLGFTLKQRAAS